MDISGAMSFIEDSFHSLVRRNCLECNPNETPSCPKCSSGQVCVQYQQTCNSCASRACVDANASGATTIGLTPSTVRSPSKGAMAGGVIGGVIFIGLLTYLVWRFCIRNRRSQFVDDFEDELEETTTEKIVRDDHLDPASALDLHGRPTSQGRESVASTVLTRASNVIPIAFIPGIIDRSGPAPPVPPIPIPTTTGHGATTTLLSPYSDIHGDTYFMPADLRDSTYSGFTASTADDSASVRTGRSGHTDTMTNTNSIIRGSVTSTVYRGDTLDIINPAQAQVQTAQRARPAMVSVRPGASNSRGVSPSHVPAVPRIDYERYSRIGASSPLAISTSASGHQSPALAGPSSATTTRPSTAVRPSEPASRLSSDGFTLASAFSTAPFPPASASASLLERDRRSPPARHVLPPQEQLQLAAAIEAATRRASRSPVHGGLGSMSPGGRRVMERSGLESPFGDQYALREDDEE